MWLPSFASRSLRLQGPCQSCEGACADANGFACTLHCSSNYLNPKHLVTGCRESRMYRSSVIRRRKSSNKLALPSIFGILAGGSGDARKVRTQQHAAPLACATSERADESRCGSPAEGRPRDKVIENTDKKAGPQSKSKSRLDLPRRPRLLLLGDASSLPLTDLSAFLEAPSHIWPDGPRQCYLMIPNRTWAHVTCRPAAYGGGTPEPKVHLPCTLLQFATRKRSCLAYVVRVSFKLLFAALPCLSSHSKESSWAPPSLPCPCPCTARPACPMLAETAATRYSTLLPVQIRSSSSRTILCKAVQRPALTLDKPTVRLQEADSALLEEPSWFPRIDAKRVMRPSPSFYALDAGRQHGWRMVGVLKSSIRVGEPHPAGFWSA